MNKKVFAMKQISSRKDVAFIIMFAWMLVIFYLSDQPAGESSELSAGVTAIVHQLISIFPIKINEYFLHFMIRKAAHFTAYFILGIFVLHFFTRFKSSISKQIVLAFIFCVIYAISDEFHQLFVVGRSGEIRDVMIDTVGAVCGIWLYIFAHNYRNKR